MKSLDCCGNSSPAGKDILLHMKDTGGRHYKAGHINVLELHGSFYEMGRQYGHLLKAELHTQYARLIKQFVEKQAMNQKEMENKAREFFDFYPKRLKSIISGMAETSGLKIEQHQMLNAMEIFVSVTDIEKHCSGMAVWGDYTSGGPLIFGRNYDWSEFYREFVKSLTVSVFNPTDSSVPVATITYAGVIYGTTAINGEGIFLELNNGEPSGGTLCHLNRIPLEIGLLSMLFDSETLKQLDREFHTTNSDFSFIINVADKSRAYCYEWAPFGIKRRSGKYDGLLVATNHFVDPSWGLQVHDDKTFQSVNRRDNLLALGEKNRGKLDADKMMDILDLEVGNGGATFPDKTIYQIITLPEELKLWIKIPKLQNWTPIDLANLLKHD